MALRVWLPLIGNLNNQGTENIVLSSGSPTYVGGKIGQCLGTGTITFDTKNNLIANISANKKYTVGAWCKNTNTSATNRWVYGLGSGTGSMRGFYESGSTTKRHWAFSGSGSDCSTNINMLDGDWHHIMFTVNGSTVTLYMDGQKQGTTTDNTVALANEKITLYASNYNISDFRLYDECLSDKMIKEISKGLILHYQMSSPGRNNLLQGTGGYIWETFGAVSGSKASKDFALQPGTVAADLAGKRITVSFDIEYEGVTANTESGGHRAGAELSFSTGSSTSYIGAWKTFTTTAATGKERLVGSGIVPEGWTGSLGQKNMYIQRLASGHVKISNLKVELGESASSYCPNKKEYGLDNLIMPDASGNGYNGTLSSTLDWDLDSPKYEGGYSRTTRTQYMVAVPSIFAMDQQVNSLTFSAWYKTTIVDGNTKNIISLGQNEFIRFGPSTQNFWVYGRLGEGNATTLLTKEISKKLNDNTWHHYAVTFDNGIIKGYLDGELISTIDSSATAKYIKCKATSNYIGAFSATSECLPGSISDVRIYGTALSKEDILTLYKTSGIIDNKGNVYAYNFKEEVL